MSKNNFIYLTLIAFVFISTSALALAGNRVIEIVLVGKPREVVKTFSALPVIASNAGFPILSAQAVLAVDAVSGVTLYEKDPDKGLLPASTTKIITALVALDYFSDEQVLTATNVAVIGQKMGLALGEKMVFSDLLKGLLIYSANDAAEVIAQNFPGGREAFIAAMNAKAAELHLENSHFTNPAGLDGDNDGIVSTARDLIRVAEVAMQNPEFAAVVGTKSITVKSEDGKLAHRLTNVNELLGKVPGVLGVKTGWTESARENLVSYVERDGHKIMIAVLGSQDRFGETTELIDWIFANYHWQEVKVSYRP